MWFANLVLTRPPHCDSCEPQERSSGKKTGQRSFSATDGRIKNLKLQTTESSGNKRFNWHTHTHTHTHTLSPWRVLCWFYAPSARSPCRPITVKLQLGSTGAGRGQKGRSAAALTASRDEVTGEIFRNAFHTFCFFFLAILIHTCGTNYRRPSDRSTCSSAAILFSSNNNNEGVWVSSGRRTTRTTDLSCVETFKNSQNVPYVRVSFANCFSI